MINEDLTEEEQLERLKQWMKKYGWSIFWGLVFGIGLMFSWQYWRAYQSKQRENASEAYQQLVLTLQNDPDDFSQKAQQLVEKYPKSPYATLGQLLLAQQAVNSQQWDIAIEHLAWVEEHSNNVIFKQLAQVRHARLLLLHKQYEAALILLQKTDDPSFFAVAQEVTGDILLEQGNVQAARQAYQQALTHSNDVIPAWQFVLQMKINSLPEISTTGDGS